MKSIFAIVLLVALGSTPLLAADTLDVYVLNVDLGNAVLVATPAGQAMLLDAGPPGPKYLNRILAAMKDAGVKQIDHLVISHYHWDHYGTVAELAEKVPIRHYIDHGPSVEKTNALYEKYVKARDKRDHQVASGKLQHTLAHHQMAVTSVAFSPDGRLLAVGSDDTTVSLWEVTTGKKLRILDNHGSYVLAVAFSPDGRWLASSTSRTKIKLWDVAAGQEVRTLSGHAMAVYCLAFTPDGRQLASGSRDSSIKFWEVPSGVLARSLNLETEASASPGHEQFYVYSMAFSPDGRTLAAGATGGYMKILDVASGECRCFIKTGNSQPYVRPIAFDPSGRWLACGGSAVDILLWDATTGTKLGKLADHTGAIESLAVSRDGRWLASGSDDDTARLWQLQGD